MSEPPRTLRARVSRRSLLAAAGLAAGGCTVLTRFGCSGPPFTPSGETHAFELEIDTRGPAQPVNRRVLGSNVGWAFGGDNLLDAEGAFDRRMLAMAGELAPTVLRYPGGTYSDVFHWEAASNEHVFTRKQQPTLMDTQRFLELCEALQAEPLITVNVVTGTAEQAARWVAATNVRGFTSRRTGRKLPPVRWWEIGNEPYLKEQSRHDIDLAPEEFARRANRWIQAMRAVDPAISIGLPLSSDTRAGIPVTPWPGFTPKVLGIVTERFDYASVHDAYMPFAFKGGESPASLYWGAAAGAHTVRSDLEAMAGTLARLRPGQDIPIAITEHSALFSLGKGPSDKLIPSPAGAIYLADVLRVFAQSPQVLLATHWSLSANALFGAIHADGHGRPAFEVLRLMGEALRGERLAAQLRSPTARVDAVGQVAAMDAMPLVEALVTQDAKAGGERRVLLINKDPRSSVRGKLVRYGMGAPMRGRVSLLSAHDPLDASDAKGVLTRTESTFALRDDGLLPTLPPHSVALIHLTTDGA